MFVPFSAEAAPARQLTYFLLSGAGQPLSFDVGVFNAAQCGMLPHNYFYGFILRRPVLSLRNRFEWRLPALSPLRGHNTAQDKRCPAVGGRLTSDLTDRDLEKLGVLLGHRRKLLRSIANLKGIESDAPSVRVAAATAVPRPLDSAERRQVTVIFADLVGSTPLSARMDPEDLREVISAYQKCVADTVRRFDGFVAKYMGDGVLVYARR